MTDKHNFSILYKDPILKIVISIQDISTKGAMDYLYKICILPENIEMYNEHDFCDTIETVEPLQKKFFEYEIEKIGEKTFVNFKSDFAKYVFNNFLVFVAEKSQIPLTPDDKIRIANILGDLSEKQMADFLFVLQKTEKVINYGTALDVFFHGINSPLRIEDNMFIDSKAFKKWFIQNFKVGIKITEKEYTQILQAWLNMAEKSTIAEDPLRNDVVDALQNMLDSCIFYNGFTTEAKERLLVNKNSNIAVVIKEKNELWVTAKLVATLTQIEGKSIKINTIREMFSHIIKNPKGTKKITAIIDGKKKVNVIKFWIFDYEKICEMFPDIEEKELVITMNDMPDREFLVSVSADMGTDDVPTLVAVAEKIFERIKLRKYQYSDIENEITAVLSGQVTEPDKIKEVIGKMIKVIEQNISSDIDY